MTEESPELNPPKLGLIQRVEVQGLCLKAGPDEPYKNPAQIHGLNIGNFKTKHPIA